ADSLSRPAGTANPTLTYKITGFVNGDNSSVVSGAPSLLVFADEVSLPGQYPILAFAGSIGAANYDFAFVNGVLTVTAVATTTSTTTLPGATSSSTTTTINGATSSSTTTIVGATSSSTSLVAVTTTTSVTTAPTTTTLADGCAQEATFDALDCRLLALTDDV